MTAPGAKPLSPERGRYGGIPPLEGVAKDATRLKRGEGFPQHGAVLEREGVYLSLKNFKSLHDRIGLRGLNESHDLHISVVSCEFAT